ncbi:MAG: ATP-dependent DNA helicase RecG [Alphaproteobacteria bacterium]|nr:ATP-dependent DNA helicase RecG [Alphaproteobacteria bacterium]
MRPSILYPLFCEIETLKGVGARYAKLIKNLCGEKIIDILFHLPYNITDRTATPPLIAAKDGKIWTGIVTITEHQPPATRKHPYRIYCTDGTSELVLVFFKAYPDSLKKNYPVGEKRAISGKVEYFNGSWQMSHPDYVTFPEKLSEIARLEPVYPLTAGVTNKMLIKLGQEALQRVPELPEWLTPESLNDLEYISFQDAIKRLHNPKNIADLSPSSTARRRLAYDEILSNQLALAFTRQKFKQKHGREFKGTGELYQNIHSNLPFALTSAQETALEEIAADQQAPYKMLRLLQGDVGSGKTVVALLSMLKVIEDGAQAALMAPTEILAKQHFETITSLCQNQNINIGLLTGKMKAKEKREVYEKLASGEINIIIGTHALFTESVIFKDLGYIVIDEQHRFGVNQRLALSAKGEKCDVLVMTATPIPRSLLLTAYGDMDYSKINELPKGRKPAQTVIMNTNKMPDIINALKKKLAEGTRAYWVCPLVEESEKSDLAAATERYEMLQKQFGDSVGLIHGKMKEAEKDAVMEEFKQGKKTLLVATTVIEVGVNVPEATIMIIEHAERFGLAQLHQLRGRIKRGNEAGSCLLLYSYPLSAVAKERLNIMKQTEDGFYIAEKDLELRGGGELLGTRQSGFTEFKLAVMPYHQDLLLKARDDAAKIIKTDFLLETQRGKALKNLLYLFEQNEAVKTYLAG